MVLIVSEYTGQSWFSSDRNRFFNSYQLLVKNKITGENLQLNLFTKKKNDRKNKVRIKYPA